MTGVADTISKPPPAGGTNELRASATGWQKIQFAVLGFIGLCGVLKGIGASGMPRWLQIVAAALILLALIVACYATFLVGRVAWPLHSEDKLPPADSAEMSSDERHRAVRSLRTGLGLTLVALILASAAATSSWWPIKATGTTMASVSTTTGFTYCGTWAGSGNGFLLLQFAAQTHGIPLSQIVTVNLVSSCS
jgi:drug/metabolite transporter (DMT)-like permease